MTNNPLDSMTRQSPFAGQEYEMNLHQLEDIMSRYNGEVAPGGECNAWGDFVAACYEVWNMGPWDDRAEEIAVPEGFCDYWVEVASGESVDYTTDGDRAE